MKLIEQRRSELERETLRLGTMYENSRPATAMDAHRLLFLDETLVSFASNDRFGLARHERVKEAAARAAREHGVGLGSPYLGGRLSIHDDLEEALARFVGKESVILFNSGYMANIGVIPALVGRLGRCLVDRKAHASIQDGYHLTRGQRAHFEHNSAEALESLLASGNFEAAALVVVDGVYSMSGDICPLPDLSAVCERYGATLLVDDAHGICSLGECGRGTLDHFCLESEMHLLLGTFNKGLGSLGGFVAGSRDAVEFLRTTSRSFFFSAALSPPQTAAARESLRMISDDPQPILRLRQNVNRLAEGLQTLGFGFVDHLAPIFPVPVPSHLKAEDVCDSLRGDGFYCRFVTYPAVEKGECILRLCVQSTHSEEEITGLVEALRRVGVQSDSGGR